MDNQDIQFIAGRYRKGRFNVNNAWQRLSPVSSSFRRAYRIAATIGGLLFLSAAAAVLFHQYELKSTDVETVAEPAGAVKPQEVVRVIDFENTPLTTVISRIKEVYGVDVINVPENADDYILSLRYEGNAVDLVATINDILETKMDVKE